jgi:hypothetical protein
MFDSQISPRDAELKDEANQIVLGLSTAWGGVKTAYPVARQHLELLSSDFAEVDSLSSSFTLQSAACVLPNFGIQV